MVIFSEQLQLYGLVLGFGGGIFKISVTFCLLSSLSVAQFIMSISPSIIIFFLQARQVLGDNFCQCEFTQFVSRNFLCLYHCVCYLVLSVICLKNKSFTFTFEFHLHISFLFCFIKDVVLCISMDILTSRRCF